MKKHLFYIILSMASCFPIRLEAQYLYWHEMTSNEQQEYMLKVGEETLLEKTLDAYGKDITTGLTDITREFSEVKEEATEENPAGRMLTRLTYHSARYEKQSHEPYLFFIDFDKENGRMAQTCFGNGRILKSMYIGKPAYRNTLNYDGYLRNKDRTPHKQLLDQCIEAIQTFGPAYYQPDGKYSIRENIYQADGLDNSVARYNGRAYLSIAFENMRDDQPMRSPFCAEVCIWKDTREIWSILFGNYEKISFIGSSYEEERQRKDHRVVPLETVSRPE